MILGPQLKYLVMPTPLKESVPVAQLQSGESDTAIRVQQWRDEYLATLDSKRMPLLHYVEGLMKSFETLSHRKRLARNMASSGHGLTSYD